MSNDNNHNKHIAIIDDDEISLSSIKLCLQADFPPDKFTISVFSNANDFVATLNNTNYDVIILDLEMPGLNGLELISYLQKIELFFPIILLTGNMELFYDTSGLHRYIFDVHFKPAEYKKIVVSVRDAIFNKQFFHPAKISGNIDDTKAENAVIKAIIDKCDQLDKSINKENNPSESTINILKEQKKLLKILLDRNHCQPKI